MLAMLVLVRGNFFILIWCLFTKYYYDHLDHAVDAFPTKTIHCKVNGSHSEILVRQVKSSVRAARIKSILQVVSNQEQHHSQYGPSSSQNIPSSTARESAVIVEVEPISELERRIEEGMNYKHFSEENKEKDGRHRDMPSNEESARGVFVGYFVTSEERTRLKSANVIDEDTS